MAYLPPRTAAGRNTVSATILLFDTAHARTSAPDRRESIAANVCNVIPLTSRAAAKASSPGHQLLGIFPRERQLLTTGGSVPSPSATTDVPPKSSISESTVMAAGLFTDCEAVNCHPLAIAPGLLTTHALGMAKRYEDIGKRLIRLRTALGINQAELCRQIKCQPSRWNQYESGERQITLPIANKLADEYGATLDWVYRGDPRGLPQQLYTRIQRAA